MKVALYNPESTIAKLEGQAGNRIWMEGASRRAGARGSKALIWNGQFRGVIGENFRNNVR